MSSRTASAPTPRPAGTGSLAERALTLVPTEPTNHDLFTSVFQPSAVDGLYPDGAAMVLADGAPLAEAQVRADLTVFLPRWYGGDSGKVEAAMALFDSAQVQTMAPDPGMRAALVSLQGTMWAPMLDHYLSSGRFIPSRYGGLANTVFARSAANGEKFEIIFNRRGQGEPFPTKISHWVHEIGHDDAPGGPNEEAVQHAFSAMAWLQVLAATPAAAYGGTELTRVNNTYSLVFLNSREAGSPVSEIICSSCTDVAPGSTLTVRDFRTFVGGPAKATPVPTPVRAVLGTIGVAALDTYDEALLEGFGQLNDTWLSATARVQAAVLLTALSPADIAGAIGIGEADVVAQLQLQPVLDAGR